MEANEQALRTVRHKVEENSQTMEKIIENIVNRYASDLDKEVQQVQELIKNKDELEDAEIENIVMRLPVFMYYGVGGLEDLGTESDMAKAVKMEVYNQKYLQADGTIQDKTHASELQTINEQMIEASFTRAYKKLKEKIEKAELVFSGAKKILTKRMQDAQMHREDRFN